MKTGLTMAFSVALCMMLGATACKPAQDPSPDESLISEGTFKGSLNAGESDSYIVHVGEESGDFAALCFENDSEAGRAILAACENGSTCQFTGAIDQSNECKVDKDLQAVLSASGRIVSVKSVEALARESSPDGYLAVPPSGKGSPVLVLHAWWGLNDTIREFCRRLADAGFIAFAPDLYHGKIADNIADAETLARALDANQARADIAEATRFLTERAGQAGRGLAVVGFSLGAYYALDLSVTDPDQVRSVVVFYGTRGGDYSRSKAAYLGHFAETDEFEPQSHVDGLKAALQRAGRPVSFHHYPGTGHWFFEPDRAQAFDQEAASLAWERTLVFLNRSTIL